MQRCCGCCTLLYVCASHNVRSLGSYSKEDPAPWVVSVAEINIMNNEEHHSTVFTVNKLQARNS